MKTNFRSLNEIITFRGGGTPRKDVPEYWTDEIPWASVKDFKSLDLSRTQDSISRKGLEASASNLIPAGNVIIPTRMALGKAAINSIDMAINQDLRALIPKVPLDSRYLLHSMIGLAAEIVRYGSGATVKGITQENLGKLQIPLPPLAEQKRIAAILDAADALRTKRREALAQLDALLQSTFLTLFGDPVTNPMGWEMTALKKAAPAQPARLSALPHGDTWLLNLDQIESQSGKILKKIMADVSTAGSSTQAFDTGNVLYSKLRPYLNKVVCPDSYGVATTELVPLRPNPELLDRQYLTNYLRSKSFVSWVSIQVAGAKMPRVSMKVFWDNEIPLPPLPLQQKFAAIVESVERQKAAQRAHLAELDTLFAALQHRAFRGEL